VSLPSVSIDAQRGLRVAAWPRVGVRTPLLVGLGVLLACLFVVSLAVGSVSIPLGDILKILTGSQGERATWTTILFKFRLPKALTAVLAGAALSVSGLQMQTLFRNPLADPYILGISSGASLGVALLVLGGVTVSGAAFLGGLGLLGSFGIVVAASLGAGSVFALVIFIARRVSNSVTLLILGLMFGYITGAAVSVLLYFSAPQQIQAYLSWTFGSFGGVTWDQLTALAPVVGVGMALAALTVKPLNALLLGEHYARSMGVNLRRARLLILVSASLLTGAVTAFCGPIGFLGVAVPHLARAGQRGADHRALMPLCALLGASLALVFDLIAQLPGGNVVLPLNAVAALFGAPLVLVIILRRQSARGPFGA